MRKLESIIIINNNNKGYSADVKFYDKKLDKSISSSSHEGIYRLVESYVYKVCR